MSDQLQSPPSAMNTTEARRAKAPAGLDRRFCAAPMMDWSDRHCRMFWRQLTRHAVFYTEMVTTGALLHGDVARHLDYSQEEHPLALQIGGNEPDALATAAKLAQQWQYREINLNCGCPSDRVQNGFFGACLMTRPAMVADGVKAMKDATALPVTVKHRIGVDDQEGYGPLRDFVGAVADAGTDAVIVHARKAWLKGLSPRENREIPPLNYPMVYRLKGDFPELEIIINGGIDDVESGIAHLSHVDGIMLGRSAYQTPWVLAEVDQRLYGANRLVADPLDAIRGLYDYIEGELSAGTRLHHITRHTVGLFNGLGGAKQFRRHLSQHAHRDDAGIETLENALSFIETARERAAQRADAAAGLSQASA